MSLSLCASFTRKLYLINHHPIVSESPRFHEVGFSKFITFQTINEFTEAAYNDLIAGELYEDEACAKARLKKDEYYIELLVPIESISHRVRDGHVYINRGYKPIIKSLKSATGETYLYNPQLYRFEKAHEKPKMRFSSRVIYGYNPSIWELRAQASANEAMLEQRKFALNQ